MEQNLAGIPVAQQSQSSRASARFAIVMLTFCCVWWGLSFPTMKLAAAAFDRAIGGSGAVFEMASRATFLGWRFAMAAGIYWLITLPHQRGYNREDWKAGLIVGILLGLGMLLQIVGLKYTSPSVSAFLTALPVIFAPLAQMGLFGRRVGGAVWVAAVVAVVGIVLLSWPTAPGADAAVIIPPVPLLGEALTIIAAVVFTAQIMSVDRYAPRANIPRMTVLMLAATAAVNLVVGLALAPATIYHPTALRAIALQPTLWWAMPALVLLCTVVALHLMTTYQPRISPAAATVVYCLEPVFAVAFSLALGAETLTPLITLGGAAVLIAVLIVARATSRPTIPV